MPKLTAAAKPAVQLESGLMKKMRGRPCKALAGGMERLKKEEMHAGDWKKDGATLPLYVGEGEGEGDEEGGGRGRKEMYKLTGNDGMEKKEDSVLEMYQEQTEERNGNQSLKRSRGRPRKANPAEKITNKPSSSSSSSSSSTNLTLTGTASKRTKNYTTSTTTRYDSPNELSLSDATSNSDTSADESIPTGKPSLRKTKPRQGKSSSSSARHATSFPGLDYWEEHLRLSKRYRKFVGGHMSAAGGVDNAVSHCRQVGGMAFALFLKNQRQWSFTPLAEEVVVKYKQTEKEVLGRLDPVSHGCVLPHGAYLINLANPDEAKRKKSMESFLDDLKRCDRLGIKLYNFHPGSTTGACSREESIRYIAEGINHAHNKTDDVVVVLENMAGQKNIIGSRFEDLADIIKLVECRDRVGVCLDTCHLYAAGYDIRMEREKEGEGGGKVKKSIAGLPMDKRSIGGSPWGKFNSVMKEFDKVVGLSYLRGIHLNDCKSELGSGLDRHENIGKGKIGMEAFRFIMNDSRFNDIPLVLETPDNKGDSAIWKEEIHLLYSLIQDK